MLCGACLRPLRLLWTVHVFATENLRVGFTKNFNGVVIFLKMFQQDDTFCTVFYSLQTALHVSGDTFSHHQELE
jgi:hypothetical protein